MLKYILNTQNSIDLNVITSSEMDVGNGLDEVGVCVCSLESYGKLYQNTHASIYNPSKFLIHSVGLWYVYFEKVPR